MATSSKAVSWITHDSPEHAGTPSMIEAQMAAVLELKVNVNAKDGTIWYGDNAKG